MTTKEFSDAFDTLLASYNHRANFGEQSSYMDVVLDEYEKSLFLTQAQDEIIKSYFDRTSNPQGYGFDDNARRQVDFSSLIKIQNLSKSDVGDAFDDRGVIYQLPKRYRKIEIKSDDPEYNSEIEGVQYKTEIIPDSTDVLFILNEKLIGQKHVEDNWVKDKEYIIVPISYREYNREMSKPYSQPLKKQAWRLFQNQTQKFDVYTELIPKFNVVETKDYRFIYRIRYVKRPQPIILQDLSEGLSIDGENQESNCELNPILHKDILEEAVKLALNSKGIETRDQRAAREAARNNRS